MVFSSLVFLYFFLPLAILIYYIAPGSKLKNFWLLGCSLLFYMWGEKERTVWMILSILFNYGLGLVLAGRSDGVERRVVLWVGVTMNLAMLGVFKYADFFTSILNPIAHRLLGIGPFPHWNLALPVGISFYTFHSISYLIDIYRKRSPAQRNLVNFSHYICLFPQLVAGPIVRYHDIAHELNIRGVNPSEFTTGIHRFLRGLAKKVLIANVVAGPVDAIFSLPSDMISTPLAWIAVVGYTLQIYFDFSGYSDMAIGLALLFGFHFKENFNRPYIASSVTDFWRRWHISLSSWFRDYVYIPLGGNQRGQIITFRNLFIVFILCGLWHGANWTFLVWGLFHGFFLTLERMLGAKAGFVKVPKLLSRAWTLIVVMVGWVFFRSVHLIQARSVLASLFGFSGVETDWSHVLYFLSPRVALVFLAGILFSLMVPEDRKGRLDRVFVVPVLREGVAMILFLLCAFELTANTYNPFIYFRF